ncbi:MAG: GDP-L-fucose synthase family protein [Thalassobaculum sp.]
MDRSRIWVCGHSGMVGGAVSARLRRLGHEVLTADRKDLDLRRQSDVEAWVCDAKPDQVIVAAGTVGGIAANQSRPAEFLYDNLMIATNVIEAARKYDCSKLVYLGASCIYPRDADQPIREEALLTGPLEPTNEGYAVAKIAGVELCRFYREQYAMNCVSVVPPNLYGPGQHVGGPDAHVCGALMARLHAAVEQGQEEVVIWGTGAPTREFLYIEDLVDGLIFLLKRYAGGGPINLGYGSEISIADLAREIATVVGFRGRFRFDTSKPDGMMRKSLDGSQVADMGWRPKTGLRKGLQRTYEWYLEQAPGNREREITARICENCDALQNTPS